MRRLVLLTFLFVSSCTYYLELTPECYDKAFELCKNNGGLKTISFWSENSSGNKYAVYCNNGMSTIQTCKDKK